MALHFFPQFLFGYDQGHSLIAGSDQLSARTEALLSRYSDAVPGIDFETMEQYWTGLPINANEYALISTWPAPEMPRPGCVWSHVVLLDRRAIESMTDFNSLRPIFRQPSKPKNYDHYRAPASIEARHEQIRDHHVSREALIQGLRAVYDPEAEGFADLLQTDHDNVAFKIWSQQWPALRHAFRFNTAQQNWHVSGASSEYWLQFKSSHRSRSLSASIPSWIAELYDAFETEHPLRELLRNAGPELPPVQSSVRLLARLFAFTKGADLDRDLRAIKFAARELPSPSDGQHLKEWLVKETLRLRDTEQVLSLVNFLITDSKADAFPNLEIFLQSKLGDVWRSEAATLFNLMELTQGTQSKRRQAMAQLLAMEAPHDVLADGSDDGPSNGKVVLARLRPELLLEADLLSMPTDLILKFLDISLNHNERVTEYLIAELLRRPLTAECYPLFEEAKEEFVRVLLTLMPTLSAEKTVHADWKKEFHALASEIIARALSTYITTTPVCNVLEFLSWPQDPETVGDAEVWKQFLSKAKEDAPLKLQQHLYATILNIAFADKKSASIDLFEQVAPSIYEWLRASALDDVVRYQVLKNVGHYFLVSFWDYCLRFKRSLQHAYEIRGFQQLYWSKLEHKLE